MKSKLNNNKSPPPLQSMLKLLKFKFNSNHNLKHKLLFKLMSLLFNNLLINNNNNNKHKLFKYNKKCKSLCNKHMSMFKSPTKITPNSKYHSLFNQQSKNHNKNNKNHHKHNKNLLLNSFSNKKSTSHLSRFKLFNKSSLLKNSKN